MHSNLYPHNWPHSPPHRLLIPGTYMVTCSTYKKIRHFNTEERISFLHDALLELAESYGWKLQSWAVFSNHYHIIAQSPENPKTLSNFLSQLHCACSRYVNSYDNTPERKVWWQYRETLLTYHHSYLARLNYVNQNPVKHKLVAVAEQYKWCSANQGLLIKIS